MRLKPNEIRELTKYISAYYTLDELEALALMRVNFGVRNRFNGPFESYLPIFINDLSRRNREFIPFLFALQSNFDDAEIVNQIIFNYGLSLQTYASEIPETHEQNTSGDALQNLLNANPMLDTSSFLHGLAKSKRCVCRVEIMNAEGAMVTTGTGFLIGPQHVLTNYHVVKSVLDASENPQSVLCRFDYEKDLEARELNSGTEYKVSQTEPVVHYSKYSTFDVQGEANLGVEYPEDQCDYAILNLEEPAGELPFGFNAENAFSGQERGWINLAPFTNGHNTNILILQHPNGQSQKLAIGIDKILGYSNEKRRIRYEVNTMNGSSGSPLFTEKFELIGLHNMGDPRYVPQFNQGIHVNAILADLKTKNYTPTLWTG